MNWIDKDGKVCYNGGQCKTQGGDHGSVITLKNRSKISHAALKSN